MSGEVSIAKSMHFRNVMVKKPTLYACCDQGSTCHILSQFKKPKNQKQTKKICLPQGFSTSDPATHKIISLDIHIFHSFSLDSLNVNGSEMSTTLHNSKLSLFFTNMHHVIKLRTCYILSTSCMFSLFAT